LGLGSVSPAEKAVLDNLSAVWAGWLVKTYKYENNEPALWPQEFLDQGGGDCEDWAGVTAGLRLYWMKYCQQTGFDTKAEFIPVDCDSEGHLAAIDRRWKITRISTPQQVWGAEFI